MAYNLSNYEDVAKRIKRFNKEHPEGRIITENLTTDEDRKRGEWVVKTSIYLNADEQERGLPKCTGLAFERDGGSGASKFSALEVCETSSRGRALAVLYGTSASREEMAKVNRGVRFEDKAIQWAPLIGSLKTRAEARELFKRANAANAHEETLELIKAAAETLPEA